MKNIRIFMVLLMAVACLSIGAPAYAKSMTDTGYLGADQWAIQSDGDIVPEADSEYDIGASGSEVNELFVDYITMGGVQKSSWGSIVSPMTDASGYVYTTDSGGVLRLYDAGYVALGAGTAIDTYILYDGDTDDWYAGQYDASNDYVVGYGSTVGTDARISVVDSAVLTHIVIGDNVNAEDKYIIFDGNATDQYIGYLDTYDMVCMGDGSTMDADMCFGIENATTPLLVLWNGIDGYGAIDIDYGSADITDHTFVSDGGTLILDGTIALTSSDVISNATDDTIRVASDDTATVFEIYTPGTSNEDVTLLFTADADADAGDRMAISHDGGTNSMLFQSDTASADTLATILTLAKTGVLTTTAAVNVEKDDSANTSITDLVNIQHFTSGTAAAGIGAGLTFDLENATGTEEEHASIDVVATTSTNGAEDTDVVFNQIGAGVLQETLRLVAADGAAASDYMQYTANTSETNGVVDVLVLKLDTSGTPANNLGMGLSFQIDDATPGVEEQASLDFQVTDSTTASENCDAILSLNTEGTIREVFKIDTDATATDNTLFTLTSWTIETNGVVDVLEIVLDNTADTATDNFGAGISISMEDETDAAEQQASIDFVLTDAGSTTEDCDVIFSQNVAGTITERVRFDADGANILLSGTTPAITIGDAGEEDTQINFDGEAQDFSIGLDDTSDKLVIGLGTALGTTERLTFNSADLNILIGDATAADVGLVWDGTAQDYAIGIDDSADELVIMNGSTYSTTTAAVRINSSEQVGFLSDVGVGTMTFNASAVNVLAIANSTEPAAHTDGQIYIGSKDDSVDSEAVLMLYTEDDPSVLSADYTTSHWMNVWVNGTEYRIALDAV